MAAVDAAIAGKEGSAGVGAAETTEGAVFATGDASQPHTRKTLSPKGRKKNVRRGVSIKTRIRKASAN